MLSYNWHQRYPGGLIPIEDRPIVAREYTIMHEWNIMVAENSIDINKYITNTRFIEEYKRQPGDVLGTLKWMRVRDIVRQWNEMIKDGSADYHEYVTDSGFTDIYDGDFHSTIEKMI